MAIARAWFFRIGVAIPNPKPARLSGVKQSSTDFRGAGKSTLDYVTRRFDAPSARVEKTPWGWTFAGKPLYAISGSWFRAELDCS
jgi:hypothetical protein